mgnify:CR=1 FL=1|nr:MAG TPA: hypothetical protein [Caudoviricetes sp.]
MARVQKDTQPESGLPENVRVIALADGFYGCLRRRGDVFEVSSGDAASWFVPEAADPEASE